MEATKWVVVKPIGRAEFVIREDQVYELNGPSQEGPAKVGIIHSYGKKEEIMIPVYVQNYFDIRKQLTGVEMNEEETKMAELFKNPPAPPQLPSPAGPKPELKFQQ